MRSLAADEVIRTGGWEAIHWTKRVSRQQDGGCELGLLILTASSYIIMQYLRAKAKA